MDHMTALLITVKGCLHGQKLIAKKMKVYKLNVYIVVGNVTFIMLKK